MDKITEKINALLTVVNLTPSKTNRFLFISVIIGLIWLNNEFWRIYSESNRQRIIELQSNINRANSRISVLESEIKECYISSSEKVESLNTRIENLIIKNEEITKKIKQ